MFFNAYYSRGHQELVLDTLNQSWVWCICGFVLLWCDNYRNWRLIYFTHRLK